MTGDLACALAGTAPRQSPQRSAYRRHRARIRVDFEIEHCPVCGGCSDDVVLARWTTEADGVEAQSISCQASLQKEAVWALVADPHIHESPAKLVRGSNMTRNLESIVPRILNTGAQHVLFNGDVAFAIPGENTRFVPGSFLPTLDSRIEICSRSRPSRVSTYSLRAG